MVLDHLVIQRMDTTGRTVLDKGSKTGTPFNKDELNAILKFGAEELFKEDANEGEDQCDIDEILRRAETHEDAGVRPGDELLSAFKVASFNVNEEEEEEAPPPKDWESIIPEDLRIKIEAQEREKEMADLYLPPRSSRTCVGAAAESNGNAANNKEALKKIKRKRKREANSDESDSDSGGGRPKKRGRPKGHGKDGVKGFTDNQVRKFIKSFKRFPKPLSRIELIAKDSGLTDKSLADLKKLGEQLIQGCEVRVN
jgi:chromodomain-helicase-DNA-binding protein 1